MATDDVPAEASRGTDRRGRQKIAGPKSEGEKGKRRPSFLTLYINEEERDSPRMRDFACVSGLVSE